MKDQIVEKLRSILNDRVDSECKVVYVLAECRKLLEKYPPDPVPFTLKMYCHWALHVDLTHPGTTFSFLEQVDRFAESVLNGNADIVAEERMFREFMFLDAFRGQFRDLLSCYDLPTDLCDNDNHWHEFLKNYAGVIEDGSLSCVAKTPRLKLVSQVNISKAAPRPRGPEIIAPFDLTWEIILQDGRGMGVQVYAAPLPNGEKMLISGIKLYNCVPLVGSRP
jgi:hypothetical protein